MVCSNSNHFLTSRGPQTKLDKTGKCECEKYECPSSASYASYIQSIKGLDNFSCICIRKMLSTTEIDDSKKW